jgi:O-antigen/teichoic acid export membrane protein
MVRRARPERNGMIQFSRQHTELQSNRASPEFFSDPAESAAAQITTRPSVRNNVGAMIGASLASAVVGVIQMFWIPKILSVSDFGYWRAFLLYAGYAGMLHLGLVDGALIAWSTGKSDSGYGALKSGLRAILAVHAIVILGWIAFVLFHPQLPRYLAPISGAVLVYALLFNLTGLTQARAQSRLRFSLVAAGMSGPGLLFVIQLIPITLAGSTLTRLLAAYLTAWLIIFLCLLAAERGKGSPPPTFAAARNYISIGWPVMLANTGYGIMQSADRISVNLTMPIREFAIYSLSQSTIYVPITIIAAVSRVAFSHLARTHSLKRSDVYRQTSRALAAIWVLLLPYYFVVQIVVHRYLPKYAAGLPSGLVLLMSVLFLSLIQISQMNMYTVAGRQRRFLMNSIGAVLLAFATALAASRVLHSLVAVAWSQVLSAGVWWIYSEIELRKYTGQRASDWGTVLMAFGAGCAGLWAAQSLTTVFALRVLVYEALTLIPLLLLFRQERRVLLAMIMRGVLR